MTRSAAPAESFVETCRVRRSRFAPCHRRLLRGTGIPCNVPMLRRFRGDTRPRHPRLNARSPYTRSISVGPRLARLRRRLLPRELDPRLRIVVGADHRRVAVSPALAPSSLRRCTHSRQRSSTTGPSSQQVTRSNDTGCRHVPTSRIGMGFIMWPCSAHPRGSGRAHRTAGGGHQGASPPGWSDAGWRRSAGSAT